MGMPSEGGALCRKNKDERACVPAAHPPCCQTHRNRYEKEKEVM